MKYKYQAINNYKANQNKDFNTAGKAYEEYLRLLKRVNKEEIKSGKVAEQLKDYIDYSAKLATVTSQVSKAVSKDLTLFLEDVDKAQTYHGEKVLYPATHAGMRDYSSTKLHSLISACEDSNYSSNFFTVAFNGLENAWLRFCNWFDSNITDKITGAKKSVKKYQERMLQMNDVTFKILKNIFKMAQSADSNYGDNLHKSKELVEKLVLCIEELSLVMQEGARDYNSFSMDDHREKLNHYFADLEEKLNEVKEIYDVTDADLQVVIEELDGDFLAQQLKDIEAFIDSIDIGDSLEVIFYNLDDAALADLGFDNYEDILYEEDVLSNIAIIVNDEGGEFEIAKEYLEDFKDFLSYLKKWGGDADKISAYLAGLDKSESKYFSEVLEKVGVGNALKILKWGQQGIDWLIELFKDYGEHLKVLDTIQEYCNSHDISQRVFNDIRKKYTKETAKFISEIVKQVLKDGVTAGLDFIKPIKIVKMIYGSIQAIGVSAGMEESAKAKYALMMYGRKVKEYKEGLLKAIQDLKNSEKGSKAWQENAKKVKQMFEFFKNSMADTYRKMSAASSGHKKAYYNYVAALIDKINLKNFKNYKIPTYKEYLQY